MSVYKVPQDVEAEDKLLGPFSFKQFVFILITIGFLYMCFLFFRLNPLLVVIPLPFAFFFGILGLWPRKDQPVEVYLAALIRFYLKPRKRIWNQEGSVELVQITAPKIDNRTYTDGLSRNEVQSRLKMLASTMDTRGWASKNVEVQDITSYSAPTVAQSDRLIMPQVVAQPTVDPIDVHESDDIMDTINNPVASHFDELSQQSVAQAREAAIASMHQAQANEPTQQPLSDPVQSYAQQPINNPPAYQPEPPVQQSPAPTPIPEPAQQPAIQPVEDDDTNIQYNPYPSIKQTVLQPLGREPELGTPQTQTPPMTTEQSNAILNLANNSDLNVSTIAREAEKALMNDDVIELH